MILSAHHIANDDTADAALETRYYPLQNWRADEVCVGKLNSGGFQLVEAIDYDTYGNALSRPAASADFDHNGGVDGNDLAEWFVAYENGDPSADVDLNSGIDGGDLAAWFPLYESGIFGPSKGACAYSGVIAGYAGYVRDRFAVGGDLYHVRHRVYDTRMGTWTRRDPLGYVDGMSLYGYCESLPLSQSDVFGTEADRFATAVSGCAIGAFVGAAFEALNCWGSDGSNCKCEAACAASAGCVMGLCMGFFIKENMTSLAGLGIGCACGALSAIVQVTCSLAICGNKPETVCAIVEAGLSVLFGCLGGALAGPLGKTELGRKFEYEVMSIVAPRILGLCNSVMKYFLDYGTPGSRRRGGPAPAGPGPVPGGDRVRDQYSSLTCPN